MRHRRGGCAPLAVADVRRGHSLSSTMSVRSILTYEVQRNHAESYFCRYRRKWALRHLWHSSCLKPWPLSCGHCQSHSQSCGAWSTPSENLLCADAPDGVPAMLGAMSWRVALSTLLSGTICTNPVLPCAYPVHGPCVRGIDDSPCSHMLRHVMRVSPGGPVTTALYLLLFSTYTVCTRFDVCTPYARIFYIYSRSCVDAVACTYRPG